MRNLQFYSLFSTFFAFQTPVQLIVILSLGHKPKIMATEHGNDCVGNYAKAEFVKYEEKSLNACKYNGAQSGAARNAA